MDEPNSPSGVDGEHTQTSGTPDASGAGADGASSGTTQDQAASPTKHKHTAVHEVPKWRFSNNAKKSLGYSSAAAGTVVEGKTSEEIVARYVVPKTSSSIHESGHEYAKHEIGRITINEGGDEFTETFEMAGKDVGNSTEDPTKEIEQLKSETEVLKQQQRNQEEKLERLALAMNEFKQKHEEGDSAREEDDKKNTGKNSVQEQIPSLPVPPTRVDLDAGFSDSETEAEIEIITESVAAPSPDNDELDQLEKQEEEKVESAIEPNNPLPHSKPDPLEAEDKAPPAAEEEKKKFPWKRILIISIIILIVVVGVLLGLLLGGKDEGGEANENQLPQKEDPTPTQTTPAPVSSGKLQATFPPTVAPSASPTAACTDSTEKLFSVSSTRNEQVEFLSSFGWVVKDVCTGEEVMKCLPCSSVVEDDGTVTVESTLPRGYESTTDEGVRYRFLEDVDDGVKQCVPDKKYMFQIESPASEECCGFDPTNFVVYYDGEVVRTLNPIMIQPVTQQGSRQADNGTDKPSTANNGLSQAFTVETKTYFGGEDDDGPCPSASPSTSTAPTATPSLPLVEFALPKGADPISDLPCQHVMEAEMIGRVAGLNCGFCGFCRWADSVFSCYQRMAFLKRQEGIGEIEGRQALCDRGECMPPLEDAPISDTVWSEIQKSDRCELV